MLIKLDRKNTVYRYNGQALEVKTYYINLGKVEQAFELDDGIAMMMSSGERVYIKKEECKDIKQYERLIDQLGLSTRLLELREKDVERHNLPVK